MDQTLIKDIVKIASELDNMGMIQEAEIVDGVLKNVSNEGLPTERRPSKTLKLKGKFKTNTVVNGNTYTITIEFVVEPKSLSDLPAIATQLIDVDPFPPQEDKDVIENEVEEGKFDQEIVAEVRKHA